MTFSVTVLGHRGEGGTNRDEKAYKSKLCIRTDTYFQGKILPENSLSSFESALEHGADGIECDVFASKDKIPMVVHDNQLARNVDGYHYWGKDQDEDCLGFVSDFTAAELRTKFTIGNNEPIPTLDEVIQLMMKHNDQYLKKTGRNYTINIELKGDPSIADMTYKVLHTYIMNPACPFKEKDFLFNSFDASCVQAMIKINPKMRCALAFATKDIFQCAVKIPGWIPEVKVYPTSLVSSLSETVDKMGLCGLDVVTSDVQEALPALCARKKITLSASTASIRLRLEAQMCNTSDAKWTDLQREQREFKKLTYFSKKYSLQVYYRADNPGVMKKYLTNLEEIEKVASREKDNAQKYLAKNKGKYDPSLFFSLRDKMRRYQTLTTDDMGGALARVYEEVLNEVVPTPSR